jgi:hypothetical protein
MTTTTTTTIRVKGPRKWAEKWHARMEGVGASDGHDHSVVRSNGEKDMQKEMKGVEGFQVPDYD